jgi:hypothetical protein
MLAKSSYVADAPGTSAHKQSYPNHGAPSRTGQARETASVPSVTSLHCRSTIHPTKENTKITYAAKR